MAPYCEDDLLPLSGLQHLVFCERQAALIHLEGIWADNRYTAEGTILHTAADHDPGESRGDLRVARGLRLQSLRLGLAGRADVVELYGPRDRPYRIFPVEYKRGRPKTHDADRIQLCAQALCLEEMLGLTVPEGALFYGRPRRREGVVFDATLRQATEDAARRLRQLVDSGVTPPPVNDTRCKRCSLADHCLPATRGRSARRFLATATRRARRETSPPA